MELGSKTSLQPGPDGIATIRPGLPGWFDVIRGLRHNPVYHHIWRLRARRTLRVPWYKRNPVVLLFLGMAVAGMVAALVTLPPAPGPVTVRGVLFQSWHFIFAMTMSICYGWFVQAVYRYVHDTFGLLGCNQNPRLRSPVDDDLALASLDDRVILAGALWAHYRALLPALAVATLADFTYGYNIGFYGAYAPPEVPDWLITVLVYGANNLGSFLNAGLGALLLGLVLLILGSNLETPWLQTVTSILVALITVLNTIGFNPLFSGGLTSWAQQVFVPAARLVLVITALCFIAMVLVLLFLALKSAVARRILAYLVPGMIMVSLVAQSLDFMPMYSPSMFLMEYCPNRLLLDFLMVQLSAFGCISTIVSVIPLDIYLMCNFTTDLKDYLWVAWWYFPVLTAVQLILAVSLARFAAAAVALRRRAVV